MYIQFLIEHSIFIGFALGVLFLMLLCTFSSPFFRARRLSSMVDNKNCELTGSDLPEVSVVMLASNRTEDFENKIQVLLNQSYPVFYRLIIVADCGDTLIEEIRDKNVGNKRLYCTFMPTSSRYMNRKKLAMSIGVKAVTTDWFIILESNACPISPTWLYTMAQNFKSNNQLVVGYSYYSENTNGFYHFYNLMQYCLLYKDMQKNKAYRNFGMNLATTKDFFEKESGLREHLHLLCGEYDMIINNAYNKEVVLEVSNNAWIQLDTPSSAQWERERLNYWETRRWLNHGKMRRFIYNLYQTALHLSYITLFIGIFYSAISQFYPLLITMILFLIFFVGVRIYSIHSIARKLKLVMPISYLAIYEWGMFWSQLCSYIRYRHAGKYEFTCHKA